MQRQSQIDYANDLISRKNAEIVALKRANKRYEKGLAEAEQYREYHDELYGVELEPPKWTYTPPKSGHVRGTPVAVWSDFHYGEVVNYEETGGVNRFNTRIAADRIRQLAERTVDISFNHMGRAKAEYQGIVVCLGGDMISGDNHEELAITNERSNIQCVHEVAEYIAAGLQTLAKHFGQVRVIGVVGNHPRTSKEVRYKQRVVENHDWSLYKLVYTHLKADKRFSFCFPKEADAHFRVYGHRFLLTHGDSLGTRGGDGLIGAIGPIVRGRIKVGALEAQIGRDFDTLIVGHWHNPFCVPGVIANGTLKGYDEYARLKLRAPFSLAQQWLFFVHPKYGITVPWPVFLQDPLKSSTPRGQWVTMWQLDQTT